MEGLIKISDFVDYMRTEGLVLVNENEAKGITIYKDAKIASLRSSLRKKKALKFSEIAKAGFFGVSTRKGVRHIVMNQLTDAEYFRSGASDRSPILVLTSAVLRISKLKGVINE